MDKDHKVYWVGELGSIWEKFGKGKGYDENIFYKNTNENPFKNLYMILQPKLVYIRKRLYTMKRIM